MTIIRSTGRLDPQMTLRSLQAWRRKRHALAFYRQFVPRGGLCFDVGANIGNRTELFLELGARVIAVEPQASCRESLERRFGDRIILVPAALGPAIGDADLLVASYHTLSSLSQEWTDAVRASGRFSEFTWDERERVPVTTLDELISSWGKPDFCKIDVEGYELEVLEGLSRPVRALSFEFTVERLETRIAAVEKLDALGMTEFNYSSGESLKLVWRRWIGAEEPGEFLCGPTHTPGTFGDVYARA